MGKKLIKAFLLILFAVSLGGIAFFVYKANELAQNVAELSLPVAERKATKYKEKEQNKEREAAGVHANAKIQPDKMFHVLLLGIDRRSKSETAYRTDIMILMSVNQTKKKIVFTSVPRDLWVNGGRINALYTTQGVETLTDAFSKITGFTPDAYVRCDFEDLVWLVDAAGGVEVDLETAFTDNEYPNDVTKTYITVSFPAGKQKVDGKDALILARSRHGNNGEGSDFKRMLRQHKLLKAMPEAIFTSKNLFSPFNAKRFYEMVTQRMTTDMALEDAENIYLMAKDRQGYEIESFLVDYQYLVNPPAADYGGAWVLIAKDKDFGMVKTELKMKLGLLERPKPIEPAAPVTTNPPAQTTAPTKPKN